MSVATLAFLIPSKHRHASLARTVVRVLTAARRVDAEVLICDQSPHAFVAPAGVRILHRPELSGLPAARNALLRATTADIVCFLDDDTDIAADFGSELLRLAAREPDGLGWGPVVEVRPRRVQWLHRLAQFGVFADPRRLLSARCDRPTTALFGCCFAVHRGAALTVGFDARRTGYALGEDLDFCLRLTARRAGGLRFAKSLRAVHRRDGHDRQTPDARGAAKTAFLLWLARGHGGRNPCTLLHLLLALAAAASAFGAEPASVRGCWEGVRRWLF